jgi:hypothetical protein
MYQVQVRLYCRQHGYTAHAEYWQGEADSNADSLVASAHVDVLWRSGEDGHALRLRACREVCDEIAENLENALF